MQPDTAYDSNDITQWSEHTNAGVVIPDEEEGSKLIEVPPKISSPGLADRAKEFLARNKDNRPARSKPAARKVNHPRASVEKLIERTWGFLARVTQPVNPPVSRVLAMQAPVAGMLLEDTVRNTVIDKMLQPLARIGNGGEMAFALLGPPILIAAIQAKPESAPLVTPLLKESLRTWIDYSGPKLEEVMVREQKFQSVYGRRIDQMIEYFLDLPPGSINQEPETQATDPVFIDPVPEMPVKKINATRARRVTITD